MRQFQIPIPRPPIPGATVAPAQTDAPAVVSQPEVGRYRELHRQRFQVRPAVHVDGPTVVIESYLFAVGQPVSAQAYLIPGVLPLIDVPAVAPPTTSPMTPFFFGGGPGGLYDDLVMC